MRRLSAVIFWSLVCPGGHSPSRVLRKGLGLVFKTHTVRGHFEHQPSGVRVH